MTEQEGSPKMSDVQADLSGIDRTSRQPDRVEIYDTTLRDGSQLEGISCLLYTSPSPRDRG